jgi:8-oxo-dGTP diphosphatase
MGGDQPGQVRIGAAGAAVHQGQVLLGARRDPPVGSFVFPGGKVEYGQTIAETIIREFREEAGVGVSVGPLVGVYEIIALEKHRIIVVHRVEIEQGLLCAGDDLISVQWCPLDHLDYLRKQGLVTPMAEEILRDLGWPAPKPTPWRAPKRSA